MNICDKRDETTAAFLKETQQMDSLEEIKAKVKKMQKIVFRIMCDIDDFCRENKITYFLSGGTCLGAVRHQGFIPWDDDADLMMPRKDYERFLTAFSKVYGKKYGIGDLSVNPEWQRPSAKVWDKHTSAYQTNLDDIAMGVFLDIFPLDGLPENKIARKLYYKHIRLLNAMGRASVKTVFLEGEKHRLVKKAAGALLKPVGRRLFSMKMEKLAKRYDFETSKYVGVSMADHYGERETIEGEEMRSAVLLPFEGREFPVPKGYKKYLSNLYGDYMTIPEGAAEKGYSHLDYWTVEFLNG